MIDKKQTSCPIDGTEKEWIEHRMSWLVRHFGWARLRTGVVVLPTDEFFPDPFNHQAADAEPILNRISEYMGLDPQSVRPMFRQSAGTDVKVELSGAQYCIWIGHQDLADPLALVATLARGAAQILLVGRGLLEETEDDVGPLVDLPHEAKTRQFPADLREVPSLN